MPQTRPELHRVASPEPEPEPGPSHRCEPELFSDRDLGYSYSPFTEPLLEEGESLQQTFYIIDETDSTLVPIESVPMESTPIENVQMEYSVPINQSNENQIYQASPLILNSQPIGIVPLQSSAELSPSILANDVANDDQCTFYFCTSCFPHMDNYAINFIRMSCYSNVVYMPSGS